MSFNINYILTNASTLCNKLTYYCNHINNNNDIYLLLYDCIIMSEACHWMTLSSVLNSR